MTREDPLLYMNKGTYKLINISRPMRQFLSFLTVALSLDIAGIQLKI